MAIAVAPSNAVTAQRRVEHPSRTDLQQQLVTSLLNTDPKYWDAVKTIARLAQLPENWDTYGSRPVQVRALQGAFFILKLTEALSLPAPHIGPVAGGGIQFDWFSATRELEIEILPDGSVAYLRSEAGDPTCEGALASYGDSGVQSHMHWFMLGDAVGA